MTGGEEADRPIGATEAWRLETKSHLNWEYQQTIGVCGFNHLEKYEFVNGKDYPT